MRSIWTDSNDVVACHKPFGPVLKPCHAQRRLHRRCLPQARLPHMDEELEHMQWQLDKRTKENKSSGSPSSSSRLLKRHKESVIFHERLDRGRFQSRQRAHHHNSSARVSTQKPGSKSSPENTNGGTSADDAPTVTTAGVGAADAAERIHGSAQIPAGLLQAAAAGDSHFRWLQLGHTATASDLQKARDRLSRYLIEDGGCGVSAQVQQASSLTHLLLSLQQRGFLRHAGQDPREVSLLVLQPVTYSGKGGAPGSLMVALEGRHSPTRGSAAAGQRTRTAAAAPRSRGSASAPHPQSVFSCASSQDDLQFFATAMPVPMLVRMVPFAGVSAAWQGGALLQADSTMQDSPDQHTPDASTPGFHSIVTDDPFRYSSDAGSFSDIDSACTTDGSLEEGHKVHAVNSCDKLSLRRAANGGAAALLLDLLPSSRVQTLHVGPHGDPATVAVSAVDAVLAGNVLCLQVKAHGAAHKTAYMALQLASRVLQSDAHACSVSYGVTLFHGRSHQHVHGRTHTHKNGAGDRTARQSKAAPSAGVLPEATTSHSTPHHSRSQADASMDVGSFGAAFYGLSGLEDDHSSREHQAIQHIHDQEVWMCVLPLTLAS